MCYTKFVLLCSLSSLTIKGKSSESLCARYMNDCPSFDQSYFINQLHSRVQLSHLHHVQSDLGKKNTVYLSIVDKRHSSLKTAVSFSFSFLLQAC